MQMELFPEERPEKLGHSRIEYYKASSILTKASGFMGAYDYTINPYSGCSFGCTYCYAAFFSRSKDLLDNWGNWVKVKENALALLKKERNRSLRGKTIYMGSVTDPYMPIEREAEITKELLIELAEYHQPRLVIQTRSPIVTRDIDLFKRFEFIQVNMTITTDSERIRRVFEPLCPSNKTRLQAISKVHESGVNSCITMTPLLPLDSPQQFVEKLIESGIKRFIIQPFKSKGSKFISGTREEANKILKEYKWSDETYKHALSIIKAGIPGLEEGREGFSPI